MWLLVSCVDLLASKRTPSLYVDRFAEYGPRIFAETVLRKQILNNKKHSALEFVYPQEGQVTLADI